MISKENYVFVYIYIYRYIYIAIFCHGTSLKKKHQSTWGLESCVAGLSQQTFDALHHHASPKKDASSPELSQHWTNGKRQCRLTLSLMHNFLEKHDGVQHSMSVD